MKVLLDTNVLVSSLTTRGLCNEILESIFNEPELLTCEQVLRELKRILTEKFSLPAIVVRDYLNLVKSQSRIITTYTEIKIEINDSDDIPILSCAIAAQADVFVTGDKELLRLRQIENIPVLSPREFWQKLAGLES